MNLRDVEYTPGDEDEKYVSRIRDGLESGCGTTAADVRKLLERDSISGIHVVPSDLRGTVWATCLIGNRDVFSEEDEHFKTCARTTLNKLEETTQDLLVVDARRTRPSLKRFRSEDARQELVEILASFSQREKVRYVQGINEIAAMFMLVPRVGDSPTLVLEMLTAFTRKYAPWDLELDEESDHSSSAFSRLKTRFTLLSYLLIYHDPDLHMRLESHGLSPNVYATSWFVTLFARNFSVECTFTLWDAIITGNDATGVMFFALALLLSQRELLLGTNSAHLPEQLMSLTAHTRGEVSALWAWGEKLRQLTPRSFTALAGAHLQRKSIDDMLLNVDGKHIIAIEWNDLSSEPHIPFLLWDCRTLPEHMSGRFAPAAHLDLDGIRYGTPEQAKENVREAIVLNEPLRFSDTHICLIGSGNGEEDTLDVIPMAYTLAKNGFRYVSVLRGGFFEAMHREPSKIIDFDRLRFDSARSVRKRRTERRNYRRKGMPEGLLWFLDRTDVEVVNVIEQARGSLERLGGGLLDVLRVGPPALPPSDSTHKASDNQS